MTKRSETQKRYVARHELVKLSTANSTQINHDRLVTVCEALQTTQEAFILLAVEEAEKSLDIGE